MSQYQQVLNIVTDFTSGNQAAPDREEDKTVQARHMRPSVAVVAQDTWHASFEEADVSLAPGQVVAAVVAGLNNHGPWTREPGACLLRRTFPFQTRFVFIAAQAPVRWLNIQRKRGTLERA